MKKGLKYFSFLLANVFFWVGVYSFYTYFLGYGSSNVEYVNSFSLYLMPVTILLSYFIILYLIPNYLLKKKYRLFLLYGVYTFIISFVAILLSVFYGLIFSSYLKEAESIVITKSLALIILGVYFVVIIATAISFVVYSYLSNIKNEDLKNKILQAQLQLKQQELKLLKMQIHPHFLFNSLNTIYGFALAKKEEAPEMILKLSNLLDYILYQIDKPGVPLKSELEHIEDYISLEKMRFHDTLKVNVSFENLKSDMQVAPMLLIPFVENGFKHGAIIDGFLSIDILAKEEHGFFVFQMKNSCQKNEEKTKGIGLDNIRKRLEMLYANRYELEVNHQANEFYVELKIQLSDQKTIENAKS